MSAGPIAVVQRYCDSIRDRDSVSAEDCCTPLGWRSIGDSGRRLYQKGTRRLFHIVPFGRALEVNDRATVFCDVRSEETDEHLDRLRLLLLRIDEGWRIEGVCRHALQARLFLEGRLPAIFRYDRLDTSATGHRWGLSHLEAMSSDHDEVSVEAQALTPTLAAFKQIASPLAVEEARAFPATGSVCVCFTGQTSRGVDRRYVFIRPDRAANWCVHNESVLPLVSAFLDQLPNDAFTTDSDDTPEETTPPDNVLPFLEREQNAFRAELGDRFMAPEIMDAFRVVMAGRLGTDTDDESLRAFDLDTQFFIQEGPAIWRDMLELLGPILPKTLDVALPSDEPPSAESKPVEVPAATWNPEVVTSVHGRSVKLRINYADILKKLIGDRQPDND